MEVEELAVRVEQLEGRMEALEAAQAGEEEPGAEEQWPESMEEAVTMLLSWVREEEWQPRLAAVKLATYLLNPEATGWSFSQATQEQLDTAKEILEQAGYWPSLGGRSLNAINGYEPQEPVHDHISRHFAEQGLGFRVDLRIKELKHQGHHYSSIPSLVGTLVERWWDRVAAP